MKVRLGIAVVSVKPILDFMSGAVIRQLLPSRRGDGERAARMLPPPPLSTDYVPAVQCIFLCLGSDEELAVPWRSLDISV